jgi:hypothetical protein
MALPRCSATLRWLSTSSRTRAGSEKTSCAGTILPASAREISSTLSTWCRSCRPDARMMSRYSMSLGSRPSASSNSSVPSIPLSGVRISWLITAIRSALARSPATASSRALISSCSAAMRREMSRAKDTKSSPCSDSVDEIDSSTGKRLPSFRRASNWTRPLPMTRRSPVAEIAVHTRLVRSLQMVGDDQVLHLGADGLRASVAEDLLRGAVELHHAALAIDHEHGIERGRDDRRKARADEAMFPRAFLFAAREMDQQAQHDEENEETAPSSGPTPA